MSYKEFEPEELIPPIDFPLPVSFGAGFPSWKETVRSYDE
jgi:hypothetical protein